MTFVSYPTICGEMTGFSVFIGVWEMMPKPKNWLRRKLCWILFARQSDPIFSVVLIYIYIIFFFWGTFIVIDIFLVFSDNLLWTMTRPIPSSLCLFVQWVVVIKLHYLIFVMCSLLWTLGNDDNIYTDWKSHQQCWNYSFARQSDPRFYWLWLICSILVSIYYILLLSDIC